MCIAKNWSNCEIEDWKNINHLYHIQFAVGNYNLLIISTLKTHSIVNKNVYWASHLSNQQTWLKIIVIKFVAIAGIQNIARHKF